MDRDENAARNILIVKNDVLREVGLK
jgi:hypothetical protein